MRKRWSIALLIISVVALVVRFVQFNGRSFVEQLLFAVALVCLYGLRGDGKARKLYHMVFVLVGLSLVWIMAMALWGVRQSADPMWYRQEGFGAAILRFVLQGHRGIIINLSLASAQWVLYVIIIILERRPINWMLLGWVISIVISPLIFNLATPYFRDHGYTFATMMWELRNSLTVAIRCLWMVGAIIMAVVELKQMGSRQRRAS